MAACGSLEHIFEKPLPENQTFLESLSPWKHIKSIDESSFTELFGELHFKENNNNNNHVAHSPESSSSPSSSSSSLSSGPAFSARPGIDIPQKHNNFQNKNDPKSSYHPTSQKKQYKHSDSFSSMNSESLSLCTEGLGFESFGDVEDVMKNDHHVHQGQGKRLTRNLQTENHYKISTTSRGEFPPPISCIGQSGKPWVLFKSYRQDGRFILKEIRIPTQEFLHACREDGRLRLQFIQSDDEILEEDDDEDEQNEDGEGKIGEQSLENRDCNCNGSS